MKHRNTKERQLFRKEFVYKYRVEFLALDYDRHKRYKQFGFDMKMNEKEKSLVTRMREEIGYNCKTVDYDIFYSAIQLLKKLLNNMYGTMATS